MWNQGVCVVVVGVGGLTGLEEISRVDLGRV